MRNLPLILLFFYSACLAAQSSVVNIAIINDQQPNGALASAYEQSIQDEILALLQHRQSLNFNKYYRSLEDADLSSTFERAYAQNDIVITIGTVTSNFAIGLDQYPKPTIGSIVLDAQLQGLEKTTQGSSGIGNFTYLESPFDVSRDLSTLYEICPFDHLEVITDQGTIGGTDFIKNLFKKYLSRNDISIDHIYYSDKIEDHFGDMEDKKVAVYALPYFGGDTTKVKEIFKTINKSKVPSAALFGENYIAAGALTSYETRENLQKIPRRIALNVMKILEGTNPSDLSVEMENFSSNLLINMETARQIEIYPSFDLMAQATLINLDDVQNIDKLTLSGAIAEALKRSLDIRIQQANVEIAETEVGIAKSDLYPQIDASLSFQVLDEITTFGRQGVAGRATVYAGGGLSQTILAEPILANIAIQKLLKESESKALLQTQLDVIIDITNAYMNILFAKSNLNIQQQNVERNKDNYDISKTKEAIGYTGTSDINRWEAELANSNISLNNAVASLRQAKFQLNQLLNRPINQVLAVEVATIEEAMLIVTDNRMQFLDNYGMLQKFSNFLVDYGMKNLPELAQVDYGIKAQERLQLSRERAMYLPTVGLEGNVNRVLDKYDIPEGLTPLGNLTTWDVSVGVSYPIFQGFNRKKLIEQSKLNVIQLQDSRKNASNQLELLIRANIESVGASYSQMNLSQIAAEASRKNYDLIKDAYSAGQANVTTLIDAQNNVLSTDLNATNAIFTFIQDFLSLERSIGYFNFLATESERDLFFQQVQSFINEN